jgi:hypothetical protein
MNQKILNPMTNITSWASPPARALEELEKNEVILARRYIKRAMKSDRVLIDARKATVPDAKHTIAIEGEGLLEQAIRRLRERKSGGNR